MKTEIVSRDGAKGAKGLLLLVLLLAVLRAGATEVLFQSSDIGFGPLTNVWVQYEPIDWTGYSNRFVPKIPKRYLTDSTGQFQTNMVPTTYRVTVEHPLIDTTFTNGIPDTNVVVNALDYVTGAAPVPLLDLRYPSLFGDGITVTTNSRRLKISAPGAGNTNGLTAVQTTNAIVSVVVASSNGLVAIYGPQVAWLSNAVVVVSNGVASLVGTTSNGLVSLYGPQIAGLTNMVAVTSNGVYSVAITSSNANYSRLTVVSNVLRDLIDGRIGTNQIGIGLNWDGTTLTATGVAANAMATTNGVGTNTTLHGRTKFRDGGTYGDFDYGMAVGRADYNGLTDHLWTWGWNVDAGGNRNYLEPTLYQEFEMKYDGGVGKITGEIHFGFSFSNAFGFTNVVRILQMNGNLWGDSAGDADVSAQGNWGFSKAGSSYFDFLMNNGVPYLQPTNGEVRFGGANPNAAPSLVLGHGSYGINFTADLYLRNGYGAIGDGLLLYAPQLGAKLLLYLGTNGLADFFGNNITNVNRFSATNIDARGNITVTGGQTNGGPMKASTYYGDGSQLTGLAGGGDVTSAQLATATTTTSNGVLSVVVANDTTTSNALRTLLVGNDTTTSNGAVAFSMVVSNAVATLLAASDTTTSNALRTLLIANDTTTSNGVLSVVVANDTTTSNALRTLLVGNDTTTSNGAVAFSMVVSNAVATLLAASDTTTSNALRTLLIGNDTTTSNGVLSVVVANDTTTSNALAGMILTNSIVQFSGGSTGTGPVATNQIDWLVGRVWVMTNDAKSNQVFQLTNGIPGVEVTLIGSGTNFAWTFTGTNGVFAAEIVWADNTVTNGATSLTITNPEVSLLCVESNEYRAVAANYRRRAR